MFTFRTEYYSLDEARKLDHNEKKLYLCYREGNTEESDVVQQISKGREKSNAYMEEIQAVQQPGSVLKG